MVKILGLPKIPSEEPDLEAAVPAAVRIFSPRSRRWTRSARGRSYKKWNSHWWPHRQAWLDVAPLSWDCYLLWSHSPKDPTGPELEISTQSTCTGLWSRISRGTWSPGFESCQAIGRKSQATVNPRYCGVVILQDKLQIKLTIYKQIWAASHVPPSTPT